MNFSDRIFQQQTAHHKNIPRRVKSDRDGKTSAQSSLAHWDEDWTLIADMTERRRIQNRIAQRNYRRRLKERLSRLEEHTSRFKKSPKQDEELRDVKDQPHLSDSSQSQTRHKAILPSRIAAPKDATADSTSSRTFQQEPYFQLDQLPFATSYALSPNTSSCQPSMIDYPDFLTVFEDVAFDYPDTQVWRRATWPPE